MPTDGGGSCRGVTGSAQNNWSAASLSGAAPVARDEDEDTGAIVGAGAEAGAGSLGAGVEGPDDAGGTSLGVTSATMRGAGAEAAELEVEVRWTGAVLEG